MRFPMAPPVQVSSNPGYVTCHRCVHSTDSNIVGWKHPNLSYLPLIAPGPIALTLKVRTPRIGLQPIFIQAVR